MYTCRGKLDDPQKLASNIKFIYKTERYRTFVGRSLNKYCSCVQYYAKLQVSGI